MPNKDISIHCIARTKIYAEAIEEWLTSLGVSEEGVKNILDLKNTCSEILTAVAAKQCYMSFEVGLNPNVTKVRSDMTEYIDNLLASKHGSVFEHVYFTFAIDNVTRVFTAEMNRHRAGVAISERSMRYIRFEDELNWWMPLSLQEQPHDDEEIKNKKSLTRGIFIRAFNQMQENYRALVALWDMDATYKNFHYKKTMTSCFRRIIGMGVCTGGVWTFNLRALRHILTIRTDDGAEEEIAHVTKRILEYMINEEPIIFGDFNNLIRRPTFVKV